MISVSGARTSTVAIVLLALLSASAPALARRTQAQLTATFKDRTVAELGARPPAPACVVRFTEVRDERASPEIVGVIGQRGVLAPPDRMAWLTAVLQGFAPRGVTPAITAGDAAGGGPEARFSLRTAWIASSPVTYNANVVIHLSSRAPGDPAIEKDYRGAASRTAYWSGGVDTLQSAIDGAFADALDAMAVDLRALCRP